MKKILYAVLGLAAALLIAITSLVTLVDPAQFKPLLMEQVKKNTGRDLVIDGPISWTFWPSLGLSLEQAALRNPAGFAEQDLVRFERGQASVAVLPLLSRRLQVGEVSLEGAHLFIQTRADGSSNLTGLTRSAQGGGASTRAPGQDESGQASGPEPWQLAIESLSLTQASALVIDDRNGSRLQLTRLDLSLGELKPDSWVPMTFSLNGEHQGLTLAAKGETRLRLGRDLASSELEGLTVEGKLAQGDTRLDRFTLGVDRLTLGQWSQLGVSVQGRQGVLAFDLTASLKGRLNGAQSQLDLADVTLDGVLKGPDLPRPEIKVVLGAEGQWAMASKTLTLSRVALGADELQLAGNGSLIMKDIPGIRFDLAAERLDLDAWRTTKAKEAPVAKEAGSKPVADKGAGKAAGSAGVAPAGETEPDLAWLKGLDLAGRLKVGTLIADGVKAEQVDLALAADAALVRITGFNARLFGGSAQGEGVIDARQQPATFQVHKQIAGVDLQPLLQTLAQTDLLAGRGSADIRLSGRGLSSHALRSQLAGTLDLKVEDGALHGINLPQMLREARATLKGEKAREAGEARKTDFSALTAHFRIGQGKASSDDIRLLAPALRVEGKGSTALVPETLDFLMATTVVETSKGQGGKGLEDLKGITIPVIIGGHWRQPSYRLDVKGLLADNQLLEEKARKEAERGLKKLLGDKADDEQIKGVADQLLKGLFK
ncbi:AsmA family protein [Aeromonas bivalvium]|uniref:AsmA family protein n=1 Tax=Aeromonas bivalvium TaxID=440079 RepID=UPI003D1B2B54